MNTIYKSTLRALILLIFVMLGGCNDNDKEKTAHDKNTESDHHQAEEEHPELAEAMLTQQQYDALGMRIDTLQKRNIKGYVEVGGELEVPPQNEAAVTAVLGGNVAEILVIEGDRVGKGEVLAYISHPDLVKVQTEFLNAHNELVFQEKEFARQKRLYEAGVGSGETFQRAEAAFQTARGRVQGLRSQLQLLHLDPERILQGNIARRIPVVSPIAGAVQEVNVKTGQYVQAQTTLFEILNTEDIHADLLVFEKDAAKVRTGQEVRLRVESIPGEELKASILSVGKVFGKDPKALHVHAEIRDKPESLIPGMYVRGRILIDSTETTALPQSAIAKEGESYIAFRAEKEGEAWSFKPVKVVPGVTSGEWTAVQFLTPVQAGAKFAYNNAYYLMAQMNKGEGGHSH